MSDDRRHALIAAPYYPPALGGVEQYAASVVRELDRIGWRTTVVTTGTQRRGVKVEQNADTDSMVYRLPSIARISNTPVGFGWSRTIKRILDHQPVDVVNAHAPVPVLADMVAASLGAQPFVLTYHTGRMRKGRPSQDLALRTYESRVLPRSTERAQRIICSSSFVEDTFPDLFTGKCAVIKPGVDLNRFADTPAPSAGPMLFVGTLAKATSYKGLPDALQAIALLRDRGLRIELEVCGDGDAKVEHEQLSRQLGIADRVRFLGPVIGDSLVAAYQRCRALVLPTHFDSFPTVLVEAMASGRPVITTPVGGIPDLVIDGVTGLLVPPRAIDRLADAIETLSSSDVDAVGMGRAGRKRVAASLSWSLQGLRTADVFDEAIAAAAGRAPTKVALAVPFFAPRVGGVENYAHRFAQHLRTLPDFADPIVITTGSAKHTVEYENRDGLAVFRLPAWFRFSNTPVNPLWAWQVRRLVRRLGIDVLHAHSPVPIFADLAVLGARGRMRVATYHSGSMVKYAGPSDHLVRGYERFVLPRMFDAVDALSVSSQSCLGADRAGAVLLSPGVDADRYTPPQVEARSSVLYVGRLERASAWKGVDVLLRAMAEVARAMPDATLRLVGGGDASPGLAALAAELGIRDRVTFVGPLSPDAVIDEYRRAAVTVLPSLTAAESFGMVLVEAMSCGSPVIGSSVGGIPQVIDDGANGLLVPPGDVAALATALRGVLADGDLAMRLSAAGRRAAVERFDWAVTLDRYVQLLRGLAPAALSGSTAMRKERAVDHLEYDPS